jgi:hypothetical protein
MENRLIELEDLQVGDEIMISCQSYFKYLRVLTPPTLSKTKTHWNSKKTNACKLQMYYKTRRSDNIFIH